MTTIQPIRYYLILSAVLVVGGGAYMALAQRNTAYDESLAQANLAAAVSVTPEPAVSTPVPTPTPTPSVAASITPQLEAEKLEASISDLSADTDFSDDELSNASLGL